MKIASEVKLEDLIRIDNIALREHTTRYKVLQRLILRSLKEVEEETTSKNSSHPTD